MLCLCQLVQPSLILIDNERFTNPHTQAEVSPQILDFHVYFLNQYLLYLSTKPPPPNSYKSTETVTVYHQIPSEFHRIQFPIDTACISDRFDRYRDEIPMYFRTYRRRDSWMIPGSGLKTSIWYEFVIRFCVIRPSGRVSLQWMWLLNQPDALYLGVSLRT